MDNFEAFVKTLLATGSEKAALAVESTVRAAMTAEQLPTGSIKPSKKDFEDLGFVFGKTDRMTKTADVTLPNGWYVEDEDVWRKNIFDENGVLRAKTFYFGSPWDLTAELKLI